MNLGDQQNPKPARRRKQSPGINNSCTRQLRLSLSSSLSIPTFLKLKLIPPPFLSSYQKEDLFFFLLLSPRERLPP
jgi:hypothetical protein